jgi:hypothetical protein
MTDSQDLHPHELAAPEPPDLPLPTFLIIGAQKSATRWLRINLGAHPDVFTVPHEVMYFNNRRRCRKLGTEWYRAQFAGWEGQPAVGEATPSYMMWIHEPARIVRRITKVVPDARLLAVLRNPVDRARSAMLHHIKKERLAPSSDLLTLLRERPPETDRLGLVSGGWYARSLEPFVDRFGDQLLVLFHDDVSARPRDVYRDALRHIGVGDDFVPDALGEVVFSNRGPEDDPLGLEERRELYEFFRADVERLEQLLGRDLSMWDPDQALTHGSGTT